MFNNLVYNSSILQVVVRLFNTISSIDDKNFVKIALTQIIKIFKLTLKFQNTHVFCISVSKVALIEKLSLMQFYTLV